MKSDRSLPELSERAAQLLSDEAKTIAAPSEESRAGAIEGIALAMRHQKLKRKRRRWLSLGSLAVAASIALAVGLGRSRPVDVRVAASVASASFVRGAPVVVRNGARHALTEGAPIQAGDRLI